MTTRKIVPSHASPDRNDARAVHEHGEEAAGLLRARLKASLDQARQGELADGSGEDAIRRAFARARNGGWNSGAGR
ncbi:MAG: hypothetical protein LAT81_15170 [Oceanicaulis sp.]|nr:hypothetical protein [Oceanicaulis sp.]